jgi:hypothetical protein
LWYWCWEGDSGSASWVGEGSSCVGSAS